MGVFDWVPGRSPKVHPPELTAEATRLANLAGMQASGQPWQEDCAGGDTTALLETPHPDLAENYDYDSFKDKFVTETAMPGDGTPVHIIDTKKLDAHTKEWSEEAASVLESDPEPVQAAQVPKTLPETVRELREALTARGITVPSKAVKADLEQLYADSTSE